MAIRVFLSGCNGRMGQVIAGLAKESQDLLIVAGSDLNQSVAQDFPVFARAQDCDVEFDVIIDFSNPAALPNLFELVRRTHKPAVICTTGLEQAQKNELDVLAQSSAIFVSANMSLGVNILISLAQKAAAVLYPEFDIEIIEAHHRQKVDAPSGTALMIADAINETLDQQLEYTYDRSQVRQKRGDRELGLSSIRGGTIVGEHTVLFAGGEETISIHHSAQSRNVFARGALAAARFLAGKPAGRYEMKDLIG
ncbi:MAG: 4-hydroxy-tetrahydrodipicolinate reductase [Eubacteriales bacterium]|nr:4-hydroxy-tetrahydrodipicolinate reductase [Eubacteriales bacterium]